MTNETNAHTELTASIMQSHGLKTEIVRSGVIKLSLRKRNVYPADIMTLIASEDLPIDATQLEYICGCTYIYMES